MKTTKTALVVMAAGMGSRYGGIKQLEPVGLAGETILEYGLFDAVRAGFSEVVFIIRKDIEHDFRIFLLDRMQLPIPVRLVYQEIGNLPAPWKDSELTKTRSKPWGTAHAVWSAAEVLDCPFAVINADDFYGRRSFRIIHDWLVSCDTSKTDWVMTGYHLHKTLSENGTVSRGICDTGKDGFLRGIEEHKKLAGVPETANPTNIDAGPSSIISTLDDGTRVVFPPETIVSMNFFGFTTSVLDEITHQLLDFLATQGNDPKAECYLPLVVNRAIREGRARMTVLDTPETWFGVTYREDLPLVVERIRILIDQGLYPSTLWGKA